MALWVVWGHLVQQAGIGDRWNETWDAARDPSIPVFVFMIISGFVITHLITEKREPYLPYLTRRFMRLAPLLWACLAFTLIYDVFFPRVYQWDDANTPSYLAGYATMLHATIPAEILPDAARSILPPAWSISLEWQFYLLAPLLLWRRAWPLLIAAGVAAIFLTRKSVADWTGLMFDLGFLPLSIGYFMIGIGSYFVARRMQGIVLPSWLVLASALAVFAMTKGSWPIAIWVVIFGAAVSPNAIRNALQTKVMLWLGTISYSIYLTHMLVIGAIRKQLIQGPLGLEFGTWTHLWTMTAICVPIIIVASWLTWTAFERPGQRLGSWLARKMTGAPKLRTSPVVSLAPAE